MPSITPPFVIALGALGIVLGALHQPPGAAGQSALTMQSQSWATISEAGGDGVPHAQDRSCQSCEASRSVPHHAQVSVEKGQIEIRPAALYFHAGERDVTVTWQLPAHENWRFPAEGGVVIEGEIIDQVLRGPSKSVALDAQQREVVNCEVSADGLAYTCLNRNTRPGIYKYTLRVRDGDTVLEKDPPIVNML